MPGLFDPLRLGAITAPNRIFMAPLTRARGTRDHVPTELMATYYAQRASAGLLISEAIGISRQGLGWPYATGLWTRPQIDGWRRVTDAVHSAGGRIIAQLWHMGRLVHPSFLDGAPPVSASSTTAPRYAHTYEGRAPYAASRPLGLDEIAGVVGDYATAARHAKEAGFDGVQLHAANGYLIDQFLRDGTNQRDDAYGGSIENRVRLLREATAALIGEVGADRTGVRLSPNVSSQGVADSDPESLFAAAVTALDKLGVAHLELREPPTTGTFGAGDRPRLAPQLRPLFHGALVLNSDITPSQAREDVASGVGDAVSFGRPFIANPDLVRRIAEGLPLAASDESTWYSQGPDGYIDYPSVDGG